MGNERVIWRSGTGRRDVRVVARNGTVFVEGLHPENDRMVELASVDVAEIEGWGPGDPEHHRVLGHAMLSTHDERNDEVVEVIEGQHPHNRRYGNHYARLRDGTCLEFEGAMVRAQIVFTEYNTVRREDEVRRHVAARLLLARPPGDWRHVYTFTRMPTMRDALIEVLANEHRIYEHFVEFANPNDMIRLNGGGSPGSGLRPFLVTYRDRPARTVQYIADQGCVILEADGHPGWPGVLDPSDLETDVKVDVLDLEIRWGRDTEEEGALA